MTMATEAYAVFLGQADMLCLCAKVTTRDDFMNITRPLTTNDALASVTVYDGCPVPSIDFILQQSRFPPLTVPIYPALE